MLQRGDGAGHAVFHSSPVCFGTIMIGFLDHPSDVDATCLQAERVAPFTAP
ncbi:hypothetical protein [Streptomyces sp. NPDC002187]|uniref:hypothetical protein n=1 Tax=Streptomyces sp. NPDC002187 TaxID=3364637 RepID=UPI0036A1CF58